MPGKSGPQVGRIIKRLRTHGIVKKIGNGDLTQEVTITSEMDTFGKFLYSIKSVF